MSLSCSCGEWDGDGWFYYTPSDFATLKTTKRKRCCSCNDLIGIGDDCVIFSRARGPVWDVEVKIYGDDAEIPIATWYMCEDCGHIFLSLEGLGFCMNIGGDDGDMRDLLKEYQKEYAHPAWQTFKDKEKKQ